MACFYFSFLLILFYILSLFLISSSVSNIFCLDLQYSSVASGISGNTSLAYLNEENLLQSEREHLASTNEQFGAQTLKSSLEHLNNEVHILHNRKLEDMWKELTSLCF